MWEQRGDGKRKLKLGAIPTIFGFFLKKYTDINNNEQASNVKEEHVKEEQVSIYRYMKIIKRGKHLFVFCQLFAEEYQQFVGGKY